MEINEGTVRFMTRMERASKESFFTCRGLSSVVIEDDVIQGHVIMVDAEGITLDRAVEVARGNFDNYAVFRSSVNSYHILNPVIRNKDSVYNILANEISIEDDNHASIGYERGDWVLRISDKPNKPMPELVAHRSVMNKYEVYSKPHIDYVGAIHSKALQDEWSNLPTVGDKLRTIKYWTFK